MTICPHDRRVDLPCPYAGCHAAQEYGVELRRIGMKGVRERFVRQGQMVEVSGQLSILWRWEAALTPPAHP